MVALLAAAKAWAWLSGRSYVTPDEEDRLQAGAAPPGQRAAGAWRWRASPPTRCSIGCWRRCPRRDDRLDDRRAADPAGRAAGRAGRRPRRRGARSPAHARRPAAGPASPLLVLDAVLAVAPKRLECTRIPPPSVSVDQPVRLAWRVHNPTNWAVLVPAGRRYCRRRGAVLTAGRRCGARPQHRHPPAPARPARRGRFNVAEPGAAHHRAAGLAAARQRR
ncbi:MAG: hypothetical protein R2755_34165 [Acidimicrobiales bacterium]